jgi:serine/threonine protein kinase
MSIESFIKARTTVHPQKGISPFSRFNNMSYEVSVTHGNVQGSYAIKELTYNQDAPFENSAELDLYRKIGENWQDAHLIVPIGYYENPSQNQLYLFMPLIEGQSLILLQLLNDTPSRPAQAEKETILGVPLALSFAEGVGKGLQTLRNHDIVHNSMGTHCYWVTTDNQFLIGNLENSTYLTVENNAVKIIEELSYFETLGELLIPIGHARNLSLRGHLVDFYIHYDESNHYIKNVTAAVIKSFEEMLGISAKENLNQQLDADNYYGLVALNSYLSFIEKSRVSFILLSLEQTYGLEVATFFSDNLKACVTDPNWNFVTFAKQLSAIITRNEF